MSAVDRLGASIVDWWREAGVDCIVDDAPRDWLAPVQPSVRSVSAPPGDIDRDDALLPATATATATAAVAAASAPGVAPAAAPTPALSPPDDLAAYRPWLTHTADLPGPAAARLDAAGDPASGTMIVVDMPDPGDRAAARLVSGEAGELLDRMLIPMGLGRETIYLAPLAPARPASGRLDPAAAALFAGLMRHHVGLVRPRRLLIFGDAAVRALLALSCAEARGRVHAFAFDGGEVPAVASYHPRFLVQTPARKAAAWADLKLFMGLT